MKTIEKIESWAREEEEERLREMIEQMRGRGASNDDINKYLCNVANRYLAELDDEKVLYRK